MYAAVLNDPASKGPLLLFSAEGGMDIEHVAATTPERIHKVFIDPRTGSAFPLSGRFAVDPRTGSVLHETPGGFVDPKTGRFVPR